MVIHMTANEIKKVVPMSRLLSRFNRMGKPDRKETCLRPGNHTNGDMHPSMDVFDERLFCRSQNCFGEKGADIFEVVGIMENLSNFKDQRERVCTMFGLNANSQGGIKSNPWSILRRYKWVDEAGNEAYHMRLDSKDRKFVWAKDEAGKQGGRGSCRPDLWQREKVAKASSIILCEGERDATTVNGWLEEAQLSPNTFATCTPNGAGDVKPEYLIMLRGKCKVFLAGDNDKAGKTYNDRCEKVLEETVGEIRLLSVPYPHKDWTEWVEDDGDAIAFKKLFDGASKLEKRADAEQGREHNDQIPNANKPDADRKRSQSTLIVELIEERGCQLFHDDEQKAYATFPVDDHFETWPLRRKAFKRWMAHEFYKKYKKTPGGQAVQEALIVLEGNAVFDGKQREVFLRVGGNDNEVFIDLCDVDWKMIHITAQGWDILPHGEVKFRRGSGAMPLPRPVRGGDIQKLLNPFLNLKTEDDRKLYIGWLISSVKPRGPKLLLETIGEQGAGKSTFEELTKAILDPNKAAKRSEPREARDLMIAASNNWVVALDNLSSLPNRLSDSLCRLSTGGTFATRQLYTDEDEILFEAKRPIIINGISPVATRPDLLDRSISLSLQHVPEDKRRTEQDFWNAFNAVSGQILGALCDVVVGALKNWPTTRLTTLERMADAVLWITAAESALGWEPRSFQKAYRANKKEGDATALECSVIYDPLYLFLESQGNSWEGTAAELLERLTEIAGEKKSRQKSWPGTARGLRSHLERIVPNLRNVGIQVVLPEGKTRGQRFITLNLDSRREIPSEPSISSKSRATLDDQDGRDRPKGGQSKSSDQSNLFDNRREKAAVATPKTSQGETHFEVPL